MSKRRNTNSEPPLLVIKIDDTPEESAKSSVKKRRSSCFTPVSKRNIKRRRICDKMTYQSPLVHLGKTNDRNTLSTSLLDDSVIVLDEVTTTSELNKSMQSNGGENRCVFPDDSVIILSDNEGELEIKSNKKERSLETVIEDDLSEEEPQPAQIITVTRKITKKKTILKIPTPASTSRVQNKTKIVTKRIKSLEKKSNAVELQSVSIDSEDENTVPNDDSVNSNQQAEIMVVDNSPGNVVAEDITRADTCSPVGDRNVENNKASCNSIESPEQGGTRSSNVSTQRLCTLAKQCASLQVAQRNKVINKSPGFCIDRKGNPGLRHLRKKATNRSEDKRKRQALQNPNWFSLVENKPPDKPLIQQPIPPINQTVQKSVESTQVHIMPTRQPSVNRIGTYYTEEAIVKAPGSLRDIVIDGCNVAMGYTNNKYFSASGLKLVVDYFKLKGHTVRVFIPQHMRSRENILLETLYTDGIVSFTPSRWIGGRRIASYDDRFILDYALMCDGIVVSLDQYRDLYEEKQEWKNIIENRLLVPTFVGKAVMFPEDPLGRSGPKLDEFLRH